MIDASLEDFERAFEKGLFCRQPPDGPEELLHYRDMARRRLADAIADSLPRFSGVIGDSRLADAIELFLEHGPLTLFLYRVGVEFGRWFLKNEPEINARARDALAIDIEVLNVANAQSRLPVGSEASLDMDSPVLVTHARAVIETAPDSEFAAPYGNFVALFRSEVDQRVYVRALSQLQVDFLSAIFAGLTPREASQSAVSKATPNAQATVASVAEIADLISEWIEHRVWYARESP